MFNEKGYLAANPDVARMVRRGLYTSGEQYYQDIGKSESERLLVPVDYDNFDEDLYLSANSDVAAVVRVIEGEYVTGWEHYVHVGINEGRSLQP